MRLLNILWGNTSGPDYVQPLFHVHYGHGYNPPNVELYLVIRTNGSSSIVSSITVYDIIRFQ